MLIPMKLAVVSFLLEHRATFLNPFRALAAIPIHESLDIPDTLSLCDHSRLSDEFFCEFDRAGLPMVSVADAVGLT